MGTCWVFTLLCFGAVFGRLSLALDEEILDDLLLQESEEEETRDRVRRQSGCKDLLDHCAQWPDKYCQDYKDYMKKNCPRKCGYCSGPTTPPVCADSSQHCSGWKSSGFCDPSSKWHTYMKNNCAKTCEFCDGGGGGGGGGGGESSKIKGCKFDGDTCEWHDVPFDDDINFVLKSSGGQGGSGGYLATDSNGRSGNKAQLLLPMELLLDHNMDHGTMCFRFYYKMSQGCTLKLYEVKNQRGSSKSTLVTKSGTASQWTLAKVNAPVSVHRQLLFEAILGGSCRAVEIDDVSFSDNSC